MDTPLSARLHRAKSIVREHRRRGNVVLFWDVAQTPSGGTRIVALVESSLSEGAYYVTEATFSGEGRLTGAHCTCPDFRKSQARRQPVPLLHGTLVCKHVLAVGLLAVETGLVAPGATAQKEV